MPKIHISHLHCTYCADDLMSRLEQASGLQGFSYDAQHETLTVPEGTEISRLESVLNADKIYILSEGEQAHRENATGSMEEPDHSHAGHHHASHSHGAVLKGQSSDRNIFLVFLLNLVFSIIEFAAGLLLNSTSIFSDAIHDFGDALSVGLAWIFEKVSMRHRNRRFTMGHRRFSLLGALITGTFLIMGSIFALTRAVPRLFDPEPVNYSGMMYLSIAAIIMNGFAAYLLMGRKSKSESILTVHMLEDLLGWIGILLISIILHFRPWYILDPILSILISLFILYEAMKQTMETIKILLESVPEGVDIEGLEDGLLRIEGVHGLSHLHFWSMDGQENNFAVTLFTDAEDIFAQRRIRREVQDLLVPEGVTCSTIELNYDPEGLIEGRH